MPPSLAELERRLRDRNTDSEEQIKLRIQNAAAQIDYGLQAGNFDLIIENSSLDRTVQEISEALKLWFPSVFSPSTVH